MNLQFTKFLRRKSETKIASAVPTVPILDANDKNACERARGALNVFFESEKIRIFTASLLDLSHKWVPFLGRNDVVIFSDPWALRDWVAPQTQAAAKFPDNLYFLCNDWQTYYARKPKIRNIALVNQNSFLDENVFELHVGIKKKYDALYNARRSSGKRHYLAKKIGDELSLA